MAEQAERERRLKEAYGSPQPPPSDFGRPLIDATSPAKHLSQSKSLSALKPQGDLIESIQRQLSDAYSQLFANMEKRIEEQDQLIENLQQEAREKDKKIGELTQTLGDKERATLEMRAMLENTRAMQGAVKAVSDQVKGSLDAGIGSAQQQAQGDIQKFATIVKKEIAIAFLKELNQSRKDGEAPLGFSAIGK